MMFRDGGDGESVDDDSVVSLVRCSVWLLDFGVCVSTDISPSLEARSLGTLEPRVSSAGAAAARVTRLVRYAFFRVRAVENVCRCMAGYLDERVTCSNGTTCERLTNEC